MSITAACHRRKLETSSFWWRARESREAEIVVTRTRVMWDMDTMGSHYRSNIFQIFPLIKYFLFKRVFKLSYN